MPQDANLDYLPPPISTYPHSHYTPSPHMMHNQVDPYNGDLHDRSYGSFTSGGSTSGTKPSRQNTLIDLFRCGAGHVRRWDGELPAFHGGAPRRSRSGAAARGGDARDGGSWHADQDPPGELPAIRSGPSRVASFYSRLAISPKI